MTDERLDKIEADLLGTAQDLDAVLLDGEDQHEVERLLGTRNNVELCCVCGWWYEASELNEEQECDDCSDPENFDE